MSTGRPWSERVRVAVEARLRVRRDDATGLFVQRCAGSEVFLRDRQGFVPESEVELLCREVYFRHYWPRAGDTVVDLGAGYGHEAMFCRAHCPGVRYVGVECQPSVYECLANTLAPHRPAFEAFPLAVSGAPMLWTRTSRGAGYEAVAAGAAGTVPIPTLRWSDFLARFGIARVALLKVNIEGGERELMAEVGDLAEVDRLIVSAHDFRADRGEGEHFRTRQAVVDHLQARGFAARGLRDEAWWRDWIFAERRAAG